MRVAYKKINGGEPSYTFMRIDHTWELVAAEQAPYRTTRRKLAILCVALGDAEGERYTLRSPKNMFPTAANQLSFDQRELKIIGHWASTSKMPERYDRSACANELLLRNTIVQRMRTGWEVAPAFHLPLTIAGTPRIGRDPPSNKGDNTCEAKSEYLTQPLAPRDTQGDGVIPTSDASRAAMDVVVETDSENLPQPASTQAQASQVKDTTQNQTDEST